MGVCKNQKKGAWGPSAESQVKEEGGRQAGREAPGIASAA
jgi:hypothetical protein